jgi:uncharacterized protein
VRRLAPLLPLGLACAALGWSLDAIGLPSAFMFAALLAGLTAALAWPGRIQLPGGTFSAAQAGAGVALGAYVKSSSLSVFASSWLPIVLVTTATLAISVGAGVVLSRVTSLDRPTGALGMVAGGASGIIAMADELGADGRLVAFMQYLRVLVVVMLTPLIAGVAFSSHHQSSAASAAAGPALGDLRGWILTLAIAAVGATVGRAVRLPTGNLLGPMILAAVVTVLPGDGFDVPSLLREIAFALIGLEVGLRFTVETVREVGRLLLPVFVAILVLLALCFGLAVVLAATTSVTLLDAYLATTPGGLYAVVAIAFGADADTTFVVATQTLRLLVMILLAPLVVRRLVGPAREPVAR